MELIKRKILLEDSIDRNNNSPTYGTMTATSFYINVMLTQDVDDMGMFTDISYTPKFDVNNTPPDYTQLIEKLLLSGYTFPFMDGILPTNQPSQINDFIRVPTFGVSDYYRFTNNIVTGNTESRIDDVKSYDKVQPYILNFDIDSEIYINYSGGTVNGVDRVTSLNPTAFTYVFAASKNDINIGTINQKNGLLFIEYSGKSLTTFMSFISEGWNKTNISLSAITKEEYLFGVTSRPEINSDVFIDRGITTILENHLKLGEITNLRELERYGKGYFNLTKY